MRHDRGRTLGGSSSINGMVFIRGHALDFEGWRQAGCEGWGYADVLPYFKRMECYAGGGCDYRGADGPLKVHRPEPDNPIYDAFLQAGKQAGYPQSEDICGYRQEGFATLDSSIHNGERSSSATAFLAPARERSNLTVITTGACHGNCDRGPGRNRHCFCRFGWHPRHRYGTARGGFERGGGWQPAFVDALRRWASGASALTRH
jgi:choline dehydrogenase-like flavoprotein